MGYRVGNGYLGSSDTQVSTAMQNIVPSPDASWNVGYKLYKFSFINSQDCHVYINGSSQQIFLPAGQGFEMVEIDFPISSFVIKEAGISFSWIGAF
jgi:hypothetical protein